MMSPAQARNGHGKPDAPITQFSIAHQVRRPSRSDYDERTRSANAIAEPQLWWAPWGKAQSP
jgi:hypothetical protein